MEPLLLGQPPVDFARRLGELAERISRAALAAGRDPKEVRTLLATKGQHPARVLKAVGIARHQAEANGDLRPVLLGENRVQELVANAPEFAALLAAGLIEVHLIGHLQKNKVARAITAVSCVQTIDSAGLAEAISWRRAPGPRPLAVLIQVNVSAETSKFGVPPEDALALAQQVAALPGLRLVGFMTVGAPLTNAAGELAKSVAQATAESIKATRAGYARLREIRDSVVGSADQPGADQSGIAPTTAHHLSMGMSTDLELAIAEGATIVRVGSAVFGPRTA